MAALGLRISVHLLAGPFKTTRAGKAQLASPFNGVEKRQWQRQVKL
jgi:hypothetical protein